MTICVGAMKSLRPKRDAVAREDVMSFKYHSSAKEPKRDAVAGAGVKKFEYRQRTPESVDLHIRRAAQANAFRKAIRRGDTNTLRDLLRLAGRDLLADFSDLLADCIAGVSFPKRLGKALVTDWGYEPDVRRMIRRIVERRAALIRRRTGRSLKHGDYPRLIDDVMYQLAEHGMLDGLSSPVETDEETKYRAEGLHIDVLKDMHQGRNYIRRRARNRSETAPRRKRCGR